MDAVARQEPESCGGVMLAPPTWYLVSSQITADGLKKADPYYLEGQSIKSGWKKCGVKSKLLPLVGNACP